MTSGMPELGSKISLISKADIRYEGRLFTVDPQECTIALSSVRSFGTEDRDTPFKIAPQSQIYDYILFRGSDIKDIRVVNNTVPHPNDPAIMQVQLPNGQHLMPHFPMGMGNPPPQQHGGPGTSGGNSGNQGAFGNPFGNMAGLGNLGGGGQQMGGSSGGGGNNVGQSMAPGSGPTGGPFMMGGGDQQQQMQQQAQQQQQQQQQNKQMPQQQQKQPISVLDMLADASRSTTPTSLISRKSPAGDMNLQQQQQHHQQQQQQMLHHNQNQANAGHGGNSRDAGHKRQTHPQQQQQQQQQRGNRNGGNNGNGNGGNNTDYYHHQQQQLQRMNNYAQYHDGRNNYNNQRNQNQNRAWTMHRGGPNNMQNNMMMRNRGGGGGGGGGRGRMPNQGYRPIGGVGGLVNKPRNNKAIKFEQDFDFEQANNKFEELRSQLSKLKVGDEPNKAATPAATTTTTEQLNGETDKKDDSGNETGAGEHEHEDEEISVGYDKTKSFFDNISCEAAQDRTKNNKTNWRQERKLNSETFGVTSTRRGSYRGRPNYYNNRNANNYMGGGGGYNRGYRGGNYRNRSNNRMGGNGRGDGTNSNGNGGGSLTNVDIASAGAAAGAVGGGTVSAPGTPTGGANVAANLKNQAQQPTNAAGSSDAPSATATPTTKAAILQENNSQPQAVAAGGQ